MKTYYSQIGQDEFVAKTLNFKTNGTFLDIGCHDYKNLSNTYFLEKELTWSGIGIDLEESFKNEWEANRTSPFICQDAITIDYDALLKTYNMPKVIDYLNVDLEPPMITLKALEKVFQTDYTFNVITFEIDAYRQTESIAPSRKLITDRGYILVNTVNNQDDFYIHSNLLT